MKNVVAVAGSLLGVSIWAGINTLMRTIDTDTGPITTDSFPTPAILSSSVFKYLPSGWASSAALGSARGEWTDILYPMLFLVVIGASFSYAAMKITARYYRQGVIEDSGATDKSISSELKLGGSPLAAHFKRDLILLYRQPQVIIQIVLMLVFMTLFPLLTGQHELGVREELAISIPMIMFSMMFGSQLGSRMIPLERESFYRNLMIPDGARLVLLEKLLLGLGLTVIPTIAVGAGHIFFGKAEGIFYCAQLASFAILGFSLGFPTGLYFADFKWEHPRRMLKGGGVFILILATLLIGGIAAITSIFINQFISPAITSVIITLASLATGSIISMMKLSNYEWLS